ncbi:MAG: hypothetical protein KDD39_13055, partial [Bdellovibrionales bacterium]|nr:hypothetical protein [Bdellovibrionales bacterium]
MHFKNTLFYILLFCLIDSGTSFSVEKTAKACGLDTIAAGEGLPTSSGQARPLTPGSNRPATLHDYFVEQGQAFHKQLVQGDTRALPDWQQQQRMMEHLLIQDPKTAVEIAALMRMRGEVNSPFIKLDEKVRGMGGLSPFLKTYALDLAHAQRLFDTEADYYSVVRALAEAEAKGEPFDPTRYEAFWPTHGFAHSLNIASNGRKIVEALQKLEPGKYQDALLTYAELMGLTHDMGMRAGGAHIRKNHAQVGPFIGLGGKVDGMETQKMLVDQFIERFTDRTNNDPLAVLLRDAADSDFIQKMYPGKSKKERQELLLREMFVGSLSHENGDNYDPKLGPNPALVAERRAAAIRLLTDPKFAGADAASVADIKKRYPDFDSNFLSWLVLSEKDYKNNPALKQLRDVFWQGEAVLNIADADRVGGLGRTKGVGNTQSAIVETPEGLVLAVAISSPDGRKALMEMKGSDRLGRYLRTGSTVVGDDQHITERVSISPLPVVNPDTYVKVLRDVSRVIGQTSSYQRRGYTPIIGHRFRSEIHIPSVMAGEMAPPARLGFETSVVAAAARVNFRNADTVLVTRDTDGNA